MRSIKSFFLIAIFELYNLKLKTLWQQEMQQHSGMEH